MARGVAQRSCRSSVISSPPLSTSWRCRGPSRAIFPPGVVATARTDGETTWVFVQNFTALQQLITLPQGYTDCMTDAAAVGDTVLLAWDCRVLKRKA